MFFTQFHMKRKLEIPLKIFFSDKKIFTVIHSPQMFSCFAWKKWNISPKKMFKSVSHTQEKEKKNVFSLWKYFFIRFHAWKEMSWNIVLCFFSWVWQNKISVEFFSHEKRKNIFVSWNLVFIWFHSNTKEFPWKRN